MSPATKTKHIGKALLALVTLLFFLSLYLDAAQKQSAVNHDLSQNDQRAYMNFAKQAHESRFQFTGKRNRMPLYPFMQALFYSPQMDDEAFFEQGKRLNVALSLLGLLALGIAFFSKFSKLYAFYAILAVAFTVFAIKSPFFQAEILFYILFGFAFILSLEVLISPGRYKSIGVSVFVLFALAHLSKAGALPGLLVFISSYGILFLLKLFSRSLNREQIKQSLYHALAPLMVFMMLLLPYFQESKEKYGSWFYNVNTTFYVWYDSWEEVENGTKLAGDRYGWPDMPAEEIPSLGKYLNEHSLGEIIERFRRGAKQLISSGCSYTRLDLGYCSQVGLSLVILAFSLPLLLKGVWRQKRRQNMHIVWYVLLFFLLYALSFAWQAIIMGGGTRGILALVIPLLWTIGLVVHAPQIQSLQLRIFQGRVKVFHIVYLLMTLTLFCEIYLIVTFRAATMYGGK